jgi:hypothetical protein
MAARTWEGMAARTWEGEENCWYILVWNI